MVGLGQHSLWDSIPVVVPRLAAQVPDGNRALELGTRIIWGFFLRKTWNIVYWTRNGKLFSEQSRIVWWFLFFAVNICGCPEFELIGSKIVGRWFVSAEKGACGSVAFNLSATWILAVRSLRCIDMVQKQWFDEDLSRNCWAPKQRPSLALPCLVNTVIGNLETKNPQTCSSFHGQIKWHPHAFCIPYRIYFMCTWNPTYFGRLTQPFFNTYTVDLQVGCVRLPGCVGTHCVALYAGPFYSGTRVFQALMEVEG